MEIIRPLFSSVPQTSKLGILQNWDENFDVDSKGASIFVDFRKQLFIELFGNEVFGPEVWDWVNTHNPLFDGFCHYINDAVFANDAFLFSNQQREHVIKSVLTKVTADDGEAVPYSASRHVWMKNILFQGELPKFLGFDKEVIFPGSHDSVWNGVVNRLANGDDITFVPSWRMITDMGSDTVETSLIGGVSGRRFSRFYKEGVDEWLQCKYKQLKP